MTMNVPVEQTVEKALYREDAVRGRSSLRGKPLRRSSDLTSLPPEELAKQHELENQHLQEWRGRLAELRTEHEDKSRN